MMNERREEYRKNEKKRDVKKYRGMLGSMQENEKRTKKKKATAKRKKDKKKIKIPCDGNSGIYSRINHKGNSTRLVNIILLLDSKWISRSVFILCDSFQFLVY